jgi:Na+-transporting methylmalonyl-CoA/oxaloacetate decarboxylase gamma subunit
MTVLNQSLWITLLSMALVFASLLLLAGLMSLMTRLFRDQEPASDSSEAAPVSDQDDLVRAAIAAVTAALAEQSQSTARPLPAPPTALVSAWQLGMRTRQMAQKGENRVKRD